MNIEAGFLGFFLLNLSHYSAQGGQVRDRLMVGHIPLENVILVRIQVPQHEKTIISANNYWYICDSRWGACPVVFF